MIKRMAQIAIMLSFLLAGGMPPVRAQLAVPGGSTLVVPPPAPIPPPKIEVPAVPQMDALPPRPTAALPSRGSFGDRITGCLQDGTAAGLAPGDRAAYSRACANR